MPGRSASFRSVAGLRSGRDAPPGISSVSRQATGKTLFFRDPQASHTEGAFQRASGSVADLKSWHSRY